MHGPRPRAVHRRLEALRDELARLTATRPLGDPQVLALSRELDAVVLDVMRAEARRHPPGPRRRAV